jgi:DNA mismatch repair ATPase MutS
MNVDTNADAPAIEFRAEMILLTGVSRSGKSVLLRQSE